ncbi:Uncharacterized protein HZ326_26377 [Fusarium oxysporum f. sp. albedinis]|nr:Uncharacterized protein HZ326_26377 [Fusarium oxysporum f. sp. albedinis]
MWIAKSADDMHFLRSQHLDENGYTLARIYAHAKLSFTRRGRFDTASLPSIMTEPGPLMVKRNEPGSTSGLSTSPCRAFIPGRAKQMIRRQAAGCMSCEERISGDNLFQGHKPWRWDAISLNTGRVPSFTPSLFKPATTYISAFTRLIRI